jgi:DNA replication and repair protein RecF
LRPGLVLAAGPNGAGKTNLLESLHVATQGFSPRTRVDANLVRFGASGFQVRAAGTGERGELTIDVGLQVGDGKHARLNGALVPSLERVREESATLVFTPDRLAVVKAGPSVRRAYVDRALGRLFPARATLAAEYADVLAQRNAALRRAAAGLIGEDAVNPWTERLATAGAELSAARAATIAALEQPFTEHAGALGLANARLDYEPSPVTSELLETRLGRDLERGTTGTGPHLDEVRIGASGHELRVHGSQGEQRVAVLALLLAEAELLARSRRVPPLLLLDDVLSELDGDRRAALVERVRGGGQVLVTAAARGALPGSADQVLEVSPGRVEEA